MCLSLSPSLQNLSLDVPKNSVRTAKCCRIHEWFLMEPSLYEDLVNLRMNRNISQRPSLHAAERCKYQKTALYEIVQQTTMGFLISSQDGLVLHAPCASVDRCLKDSPPLKLLIFDLNGVLVDRPKKGKNPVARPGLEQFLRSMFARFAVAIWTSAIEKNALECLQKVLSAELRHNIFLFLTRKHCTPYRTKSNPHGTVKDMGIIWRNQRIYGKWDEKSSLLFDDSPEKGIRHPRNIVVLPTFTKEKLDSDHILEDLSRFLLSEVLQTADVRHVSGHWNV